MPISCFIEYQLVPQKIVDFEQYVRNWLSIIPRCGGELTGYYLPHEGTNCIAYGIIQFDSLRAYEAYRSRLKKDEQARANFALALKSGCILEERRSFLKIAELDDIPGKAAMEKIL